MYNVSGLILSYLSALCFLSSTVESTTAFLLPSTTEMEDLPPTEKEVHVIIIEWLLIVALVLFSGLFSGLNLGLMGLDPIGLQIVMASDNAKNRECAKKIQPLRKHGNWLLCTLLIGNVAVNAALSILLADKTSGTIGFFVSTAVITVFGEIVPQALCSRYALEIGAKTIWIVWPLMWIMAVVAYPIAFLLDKVLGDELGTVYSNKELQKLVEIHAEIEGTGVSDDTAGMLKGALGLKDALVSNCMTEMKDVFWLNDQSKLSFDVLTEIFKSGHSRIPIFNTQDKFGRIACVGLLYVKDLILLDPDDEMPVTQIMNAFKHKTPPIVWKDDTLQHLLEIFVKTSQHLAFVQDVVKHRNTKSNAIHVDKKDIKTTAYAKRTRFQNYIDEQQNEHDGLLENKDGEFENELDNTYEYVGIITLEDVIEHVLQTQLIDEHDNFVDNKHMLRTNRLNRIDWSMLHIFDHRQRVLTTLPPQELQAVYHFLTSSIKQFSPKNRLCSEASIKNLLATSSVLRVVVSQDEQIVNAKFGKRIKGQSEALSNQLTQRDPYKDIEDNGLLLYQRDKKTKYFTLLLDGKCEIYAGRQGFRCELTRWSYLCPDALDHSVECYRYNKPLLDYVPDFTAKIIENSRVLRIKLDDFRACLEGKFDFDAKAPTSPMTQDLMKAEEHNTFKHMSIGFATRNTMDTTSNNVDENENGNETYQYPNTYHLNVNTTPSTNDDESKSDSIHNEQTHKMSSSNKIKQIFSIHKKSKKKKDKNNYNTVNIEDSDSSDHNHHHHHHHHKPIKPQIKNIKISNRSNQLQHHHSDGYPNDSLFNEREPLMQSVSDPHIITQLPTPRTISDNSQQNLQHIQKRQQHQHSHSHHHRQHHQNPNYRLNSKNNLGNTFANHFDEEDHQQHPPHSHSPQAQAQLYHNPSSHTSNSALLGSNYIGPSSMHTIIEVEDHKTSFPYDQQQRAEMVQMQSMKSTSSNKSRHGGHGGHDTDDNKRNTENKKNRFKKIANVDNSNNNAKSGDSQNGGAGAGNTDNVESKDKEKGNNGKEDNNEGGNNANNKDDRKASVSFSQQHVYKKKKRTISTEQTPENDKDQLHLYTTPNTSNVSELAASQQYHE